ncbi:MAG: aspartate aminotransferase family protein [Chitinophagales bacterium]|nr:aspartate aminotransferase family protein [Chitinophagales bacterium]MCO5280105.1 aspartate aminotransferase family protein [Chitinophagales bacterium]OJV27225.1 MAG: hypothetical protein BGO32_05010 [Bacteroidetes bacterium 37-13]HRN94090.1 aspartate aminotransferase family protein [Chitinophagales bacterium]HRP39756.1 aspartate aminotransferase family protein [Chitinophagales bacterium]
MFKQLPEKGLDKAQIFSHLEDLKKNDADWKKGRVFSLVFHPGDEASEVVKEAYKMYSSENGLNPTVFKSLKQMENDVISFTASLLHAPETAVGTMTSGGTESIISAVKAAKKFAMDKNKSLSKPNIVLPESAHPAFNKAADYFSLEVRSVKCLGALEPDLEQYRSFIDGNTVMIVGSSPAYPHGHIDPLEKLSELAIEKDLWFHVDACVGGFLLPFLEQLGHSVPVFDFRLPGVSSISLDIHKYGYGPKGSSVVFYRNSEKRKKQFFVYTKWIGGLYVSPSISGTRPGGAIAGSWAIMNFLGTEGYKKMAQETLEAAQKIQRAVNTIPELQVTGNPLTTIFSIKSTGKIDIYRLGDELSIMGWHLDRQLTPPTLHMTISYGHVAYADEFIRDLKLAVEKLNSTSLENIGDSLKQTLVKQGAKLLPESWLKKLSEKSIENVASQESESKSAPLYGLIGELSGSGTLEDMVLDLLDNMNKPSKV